MRKNKRIMFVITLIIIFLILLLVLLYYYVKIYGTFDNSNNLTNENTKPVIENNIDEKTILYTDTSIQPTTSSLILLAIQDCINSYYEYNFNGNSKALYELLNDDYIQRNNLTQNNVLNKVDKISQKTNFFVTQVYQKEISFDQEYRYYVYGENYNDSYNAINSSMFVVNLDYINMTFNITPYGNLNESTFIATMNRIISSDEGGNIEADSSNKSSIKSNEYNSFEIAQSEQLNYDIIENYINYYYYLTLNNLEKAYSLLDEEYGKLRFSNINNFNNYIKNNFTNNINIEYINVYNNSGINTYIALDEQDKYYIFIEESPMKFTVMFDSYTKPLSQTIERYNKSSDIQKACMCVEEVKEMINNNDYQTIYNHLNKVFATNNFNNINALQNFIESKYYDYNKFSYDSYTISNENYIIKVKVSNIENESEYFETDFVVQLGEDINNFEMSFSTD